jgi:hypothetical protein
MDSNNTSGISKAWKAALLTTAFGGLLLFGGTASARAENCPTKLYKQEQKLNDAINRHGYNSRQANHERHELGEVQQKCGYQNYGYNRDRDYNRYPYYHRDPYYGRDPYGNYGRDEDYRRDRDRNRHYRRDRDYDGDEDYGYRRDRHGNYHRNGNYNRNRDRHGSWNRENEKHDDDEH